MRTDDTRDQAVERLLRRSLEIGGQTDVSPDCLDAETLAAWTDGTLRGAALTAVEAHVAGCARCLSMAAVMTRTVPATSVAVPWWRRSLGTPWLVPLTAGVVAVAVWSVVPNRAPAPGQPVASVSAPAEPAARDQRADTSEAPRESKDTPSTSLGAEREGRNSNEKPAAPPPAPTAAADAFADSRQLPSTPAAKAPAAAAAPARSSVEAEPPARARETQGALMKQEAFGREVTSPNPAIRWRLGAAGAIDRTEDGGATWTSLASGVASELIAGASPASSVCWVVGRNGTVLRTTDGRTWERIRIPDSADLVSVEAADALNAVVATADGRRLQTSDGGQTWIK